MGIIRHPLLLPRLGRYAGVQTVGLLGGGFDAGIHPATLAEQFNGPRETAHDHIADVDPLLEHVQA